MILAAVQKQLLNFLAPSIILSFNLQARLWFFQDHGLLYSTTQTLAKPKITPKPDLMVVLVGLLWPEHVLGPMPA